MEEFFFEVLATLFGTLTAGLLAFAFALYEYKRKLVDDGLAVTGAYLATINAINESLQYTKDATEFFEARLAEIPPDGVYDFRREDWFSVHHSLCSDIGRLVHIDRQRGQDTVEAVSRFFQKLKYSRELYAYLILLQKAAALFFEKNQIEKSNDMKKTAEEMLIFLQDYVDVLINDDAKKAIELLEQLKMSKARQSKLGN